MCGRQFIPGHERLSPMQRPTCDRCGAGMHLFKKRSAFTVFRCARYPACRRRVRVENSPLLRAEYGRGEDLPEAARE
jgi:ssDNA-binding Zn-finger/Zn-ribbon topoisomerase 1